MRSLSLLFAFVGVVSATVDSALAQTLGCVGGGSGGPVPVWGTGGGAPSSGLPPYPGVYTLNVPALPPGASVVSEVKILGITHTFAADLHFVLTSPDGVSNNLLFRLGGSCDFAGDYALVPGCTSTPVNSWSCTGLLTPGAYVQFFGMWSDGGSGLFNPSIANIPAATGVWTLTVYDWDHGDIGNVNSWELCFGAAPTNSSAPSGAPTPTTPQDGSTRFGPTIELGWFADACATSYDIEVDGLVVGNATSSSFGYSSSAGVHDWRVRARNSVGVGPWSVVQSFTDLGSPPAPCTGEQLTTLFDRDTSAGGGSILFFDIDVLRPSGILVSELDTNTGAPVGAQITLQVYLKSGTHVGATNNASAWTLVSSGAGVAVGPDEASRVDIDDFQIPFGLHALGVRILGGSHMYAYGSGANQVHANADISLSLGQLQITPFVSTAASSRVWNGTLRYDCIPPPSAYCTSGTSTSGCLAAISASATPSATLATPCQIDVSNVEGQKHSLIFYGIDNAGFTPRPWAFGSSSYLCVNSPIHRAVAMNSGGAAGACNGALALDWNAYQAAHPSALGNPFTVGARVYVQAWHRDPPAPRAANLSNAIELTVGP
jgi:hypothetical protein